MPPLLLASASPRRRELLGRLGIPFEVVPVPFRERTENDNAALSPAEFAWYNASGKARAAARLHPGRAILAADTIVVLGARIFGKPRDRTEAEATLATLVGRRHDVLTAVVHVSPDGGAAGSIVRTGVHFRPLDAVAIGRYLDAVHVLDKAGAYAVQDRGAEIIERIEGSLTNVIGLPLETVSRLLGREGGKP